VPSYKAVLNLYTVYTLYELLKQVSIIMYSNSCFSIVCVPCVGIGHFVNLALMVAD